MKRKPNDYGTIKKLSGNRTRPFAAYTPKREIVIDGKIVKKREIIDYFETATEAEMALANWNQDRGSKINYTLEQLYNEWSRKNYPKISKSTASCYRAAWNKMSSLYHVKVKNIRSGHFQDIVDRLSEMEMSFSSIRDIKLLAGQLEKYAMSYDIISKNYAEYVELPPAKKEEREIFSAEQLATLEEAAEADFMYSRLIIILIYTGWRIGEFLGLTSADYDAASNAFTGGSKTDYGKNRVVPVHPHIQGYIDDLLAQNGPRLVCKPKKNDSSKLTPVSVGYFREEWFKPTLKALNILRSDGKEFTPHVTRHTFATNCWRDGVDPLVAKKILGHSPKGSVTEKTYTHVGLSDLEAGMNKIKSTQVNKSTQRRTVPVQ